MQMNAWMNSKWEQINTEWQKENNAVYKREIL
jgi:hypothetical protein